MGFGDCDGVRDNGCETNLADPASCGACDSDCAALPNVRSASCDGTACTSLVCEQGFDDCDARWDDGCEQSLSTLQACGACGAPCTRANADATCMDRTCIVTGCHSGHDDCNADASDGCEADLAAAETCGSCDNACAVGVECVDGSCATCSTDDDCAQGLSCCDGNCVLTDSACQAWPCAPGTAADPGHCGVCNVWCAPSASFYCALP